MNDFVKKPVPWIVASAEDVITMTDNKTVDRQPPLPLREPS
jgi:hypothetical protein